jgi:hypothetical protein
LTPTHEHAEPVDFAMSFAARDPAFRVSISAITTRSGACRRVKVDIQDGARSETFYIPERVG